MPNFNGTGPHGEGSQTGKGLGRCSSNEGGINLERRMRQHQRGCKNKTLQKNDVIDFGTTEIVGMKRCRKRNHHHQ